MDNIGRNFILEHLGGNFKLIRLDDRFKRRGMGVHRKDVYLVKVSNRPNSVLLYFSSKYKTIFQNFMDARDVMGNRVVGDKWKIDKENLLILLPYLGSVFDKPSNKSLISIITFLRETNDPVKFDNFKIPRYLSNLFSLNNNRLNLSQLNQLIALICDKKMKFGYGPGVEDPAFRNFTNVLDRAYLVDLDNFSTKISLSYELGFLAADMGLEYGGITNELSVELQKFERTANIKINKIQFYLGYLSRLGTILIDFLSDVKVSVDFVTEVGEKVEDLSLELRSTLV